MRRLNVNYLFDLLFYTFVEWLPLHFRLPVRFHYCKITRKLENELFYLEHLIQRTGSAIDIGANAGLYSYALSKVCDKVEAFEPQSSLIEEISKYGKNFNKNIKTYRYALSNTEGVLALKIPVLHGFIRTSLATGLASFNTPQNCNFKELLIPVKTLDSYEFKNVVFIKIDVEGHEFQVIEGARLTILREKPTLLVEIEQRHLGNKPIYEVFNYIQALGYEGSFLYKNRFCPLNEFSSRFHQDPLDHSKQYVSNFIFKPMHAQN